MTGPADGSASRIHATCVVLGEAGVLLRGSSGSGKSALARALIRGRRELGGFAALVADDRVELVAAGGRLLARPVPGAAGLVEVRGLGLVREAFEPGCVVRLLVDLSDRQPDRMPEEADREERLLGVAVPRIRATLAGATALVEAWFRCGHDTNVTER